jgi:DNA-directed RNA polymerase specialized sigma24 family protein
MKTHHQSVDQDARTLGLILSEVIDRLRRGDRPTASEYVERYPHLREDIEAHFQTIFLLEGEAQEPPHRGAGQDGSGSADQESSSHPIAEMIAEQPPLVQRLIFLRNFQRLRWEEIAAILNRPEAELRRSYARALREIIERCTAEGANN